MPRVKKPKSETLAQLIDRRLSELDRSARQAASHSHEKVSHFQLSRYRAGYDGKPSLRTAEGISLALDVPLDEVLRAVGMPMVPGEFELPSRAHLLTAKEREAVISVIDAILASRNAVPDAKPGQQAKSG